LQRRDFGVVTTCPAFRSRNEILSGRRVRHGGVVQLQKKKIFFRNSVTKTPDAP
jgi:hypothetical protein